MRPTQGQLAGLPGVTQQRGQGCGNVLDGLAFFGEGRQGCAGGSLLSTRWLAQLGGSREFSSAFEGRQDDSQGC